MLDNRIKGINKKVKGVVSWEKITTWINRIREKW
jgi:hypothetical protein